MAGSPLGMNVRHGSRVITRGTRLLLLSLLGLQLCFAEGPIPYPAIRGKATASSTSSPPADDAAKPDDRESWHQALLRDRKLEQRLRTAARHFNERFDARELHEGLVNLQAVLNHAEDGFVRLESLPVPLGAHHVAGLIMGRLPPEALRLYQDLYGGEADKLLAAARAKHNPELVGEVVRRFYYTAAGFEACDWLATRSMDQGGYDLAAMYWRRLLDEPAHRDRLRPMQRLKAALAFQRSGHPELAEALVHELKGRTLTVAGQSVQPELWLAQHATAGAGIKLAGAPVVGGAPCRNGVARGSAPLLRHPVWTASLASANTRHLQSFVNLWESKQLGDALPVGMAHFPVATNGRLVFRDYEGIRALDLASGEARWFYRTTSSLSRDVPPQNSTALESNSEINLKRLLVGNGALGMLASDGERVFAIDQLESRWTQPTGFGGQVQDTASINRQTNQLIALDLNAPVASVEKTLWSVGGAAPAEGEPRGPLAGHFFLGPPLPIEGRLYAVTEEDQQLNLVCLRPETGAVVWSQPLCAVTLPISADVQRYYLSCSPSYAQGVLICPTQSGVLVAVDPLSGTLLWAYSYEDPDQRQQMYAWPSTMRKKYGQDGYPNLPMIEGDSIVYLPAYSEAIHCIDLHTGRPKWRARREDFASETAMEYVATSSAETVVIVGRRRCRGLSLRDGKEQWSIALASLPAGRGARIGANYLVPLADGGVVNLQVATGKRVGLSLPAAEMRPGNLLVCGDVVVSMGRTEIIAFPQAGSSLGKTVVQASHTSLMPPNERLLAAERELALGQTVPAKAHLGEMLHSGVNISSDGIPVEQAEALLREVLFTELQAPVEDRLAVFNQLASLVKTPEQRGRYLLLRSAFELERKNAEGLLAAVRELISLDLKVPLAVENDPSRSVSVDAALRRLLTRARIDLVDQESALLTSGITGDLYVALRNEDIPLLRHLICAYSAWPQADMARVQLADMLWDYGEPQEAELLLLDTRRSGVPSIAGEATCLLAELWDERGLFHEAGKLLHEIGTRFAEIEVAPGRTGMEYLADYPREKLSWEAYLRFSPPRLKGTYARIGETRWLDEKLQERYSGNGVQPLSVPRGFSFDLFDKSRNSAGTYVAVDRHTGMELPEFKVPGSIYYPQNVQQSYVGHLLPVGGPWSMHGVSLVERKVVWTTAPFGNKSSSDLARGGPAGPGFAAFQCKQHLCVLDPSTGHVLWTRNDLEGTTGLLADPREGLIGDAEALVIFASDKTSYTVYSTATGEELRRGKLELDLRQQRRSFGRLLFHSTASADNKKLRIWDPLTDRVLWEAAADDLLDTSPFAGSAPGTKLCVFVSQLDELAYITATGRIRVIDVRTGDVRLDAAIEGGDLESISLLRVFADHERYYVNVQRVSTPGDSSVQNTYYISDALIPTVVVQGELCAFDRATQQPLWQQTMGSRSVLQLAEYRLPVLVTVCRVKHDNQQLSLQVEVLDARTGELRAVRDNLLGGDRLVQLSYERSPARLELRGPRTEIRVEFTNDPRLTLPGETALNPR